MICDEKLEDEQRVAALASMHHLHQLQGCEPFLQTLLHIFGLNWAEHAQTKIIKMKDSLKVYRQGLDL